MEDQVILEALLHRDEDALRLVREQYGAYVRKTAFSILRSEQDAEEVESDALLKLWQLAGEEEIYSLKSCLTTIARQSAIDLLRKKGAARRGSGDYVSALEELEECLPSDAGDPADALALRTVMNGFLRSLPSGKRRLFLCRYWYGMSVKECAGAFRMSESAVKTALHRCRRQLRKVLEEEEML